MHQGWATGENVAGRFRVVASLPQGWARATVGEGGGEVVIARVPASRATGRLARRVQSVVAPGLVPPRPPDGDVWVSDLPGQAVAPRAPLDEEAVLALARDVGSALAAAHSRGVVHGALGLEHVRELDGHYLLVGTGVARARGERLDERADVYGFGQLLYHALTGAPPFVVPAEKVPPRFRASVLRCLQKDPERRYGSVADALAALGIGGVDAAVAAARARGRGWVGWSAAAAITVLLVGTMMLWRPWRAGADSSPDAARGRTSDAGDALVSAPRRAPRQVVLVAPFDASKLDAEHAWLASGVRELVAAALFDSPSLEVARSSLPTEGALAAAKRAGVDLIVEGSLEPQDDGYVLQVKLVDVRGGALRLAERGVAHDLDEVMARGTQLATAVRRGAEPGGQATSGALSPGLTPTSTEAWQAHARGQAARAAGDATLAEKSFRAAIAADATWLSPRMALVETLAGAGRVDEARAAAAETRPIAVKAGPAWPLWLDAAAGADLGARTSALEALRDRFPRDPELAAGLTAAYREAGRSDACLAEGKRALANDPDAAAVHRELVWCQLLAGDANAASEEADRYAKAAGERAYEVVGDVALLRSKYGAAREAWKRAAAAGAGGASAKLPLADWYGRGRCVQAASAARRQTVALVTSDRGAAALAARVWALASMACGDYTGAREAEDFASRRLPGSGAGEAIGGLVSGARGAPGSYAKAENRLAGGALLPPLERAERWTAALSASRSEKTGAAALKALGSPTPLDRYVLLGPPLLYEVAMTQIAVGDAEAAALSCSELSDVAPDFAPALYCKGRAAEAAERWSEAFAAYRTFLDRWADGDPENRLWIDVRRRLPQVIARARAPRPAEPAAPPPPPAP
jgi:tetratricopeptide (TPR) repeat protein/TolB-like protein